MKKLCRCFKIKPGSHAWGVEKPLPSVNWPLPSQPLRKGSKVIFHPFLMKNESWRATGCPPHAQALPISLFVAFTSSQLGAGPRGWQRRLCLPPPFSSPSCQEPWQWLTGVGFQGPPHFEATSGDPWNCHDAESWEPPPSALRILPIPHFAPASQEPWYYPHLTTAETEAQRGQETCPRRKERSQNLIAKPWSTSGSEVGRF